MIHEPTNPSMMDPGRPPDEDRPRFLLELSDILRAQPDEQSIKDQSVRLLGEHLRVDRCWISEVFEQEGFSTVGPEHLCADLPPMSGVYQLSDYPETMRQLATQPIAVDNAAQDARFSAPEKALLASLSLGALLVVALRKGPRQVVWAMAVAMSAPRVWQESERALMEDVAERVWAAVERAQAEAALRRSETRYRTLFQTTQRGYAEIELVRDADGQAVDYRPLLANPQYERLAGTHSVATVGEPSHDRVPDFPPFWLQTFERIVRTGGQERFEGDELSLNRWWEVHASALGGDRLAILYDDITVRKQAEQQLRERAKRQAFLLQLGDAMRVLVDPAAIQGEAVRQLREHFDVGWVFYAEFDETESIATILRDAVQDGLPSLAGRHDLTDLPEYVKFLRSGQLLNVPDLANYELLTPRVVEQYSAMGVRAMLGVALVRQGRLLAQLVMLDTSPCQWTSEAVELINEVAERTWAAVERAKAEEALREADRRKDEFLAMLAHELRNPLAPISTGLELIRLAGDNAASVARVRSVMERQVGHMVRLIDDLLDVSRITSGKIHLQRKPTPLIDLINGAVDANRAALESARIELTIRVPEEPCILDVDPTRMVQVLSNLLHNASKFTSPGGHVAISAKRRFPDIQTASGDLELTIRDDGVGISRDLLPRVFDLFTQGESSGRAQPGLGIGLALAKRLVEMHGGTIEAASEGQDCGSVFTIRMSLARQFVTGDPPLEAVVPTAPRRVVVIDDNEDAARTMAMLVEALGGEARVALNGEEGLRAVREFQPDLVILDIGMPGMDGYDTCRHIRRGPQGKDVFIVALTGWGQEQDKTQAVDAGFDAHLTKPADSGLLARILADSGHDSA